VADLAGSAYSQAKAVAPAWVQGGLQDAEQKLAPIAPYATAIGQKAAPAIAGIDSGINTAFNALTAHVVAPSKELAEEVQQELADVGHQGFVAITDLRAKTNQLYCNALSCWQQAPCVHEQLGAARTRASSELKSVHDMLDYDHDGHVSLTDIQLNTLKLSDRLAELPQQAIDAVKGGWAAVSPASSPAQRGPADPQKLAVLNSMGFTDNERNSAVLAAHNGDVQAAALELSQ